MNPPEIPWQISIEELCLALRGESVSINTTANQPFSELFQPLVGYASAEIEQFSQEHEWLAAALPGLQTQLLHRLCSVAAIPLYLWFHLHKNPLDHSSYERFVERMRSAADASGWNGLLLEYPELGRLLIAIVSHWKAASFEFLQRLRADRSALEQFLGVSDLAVESANAGLSDSHHLGRSVIRIRFRSGVCLAYKPRDLDAEETLARLLDTIAADDAELTLPSACVLIRSQYGWMRWIDPDPATDSLAWYRKAGMLQCLLQLLGATDAHMANCIATAAGPALVDCECLLMPRLVNSEDPAGAQTATGTGKDAETVKQIALDLQSTGLLPLLDRRPGEPDLSGLFGRGGQAAGCRIPVWTRDRGEAPQLNFRPTVLRPQANLLDAGSPQLSRMAVGRAFAEGFAKMHGYLERNHSRVLDALAPLADHPTRVLLRNTRRYTHILSRSIHPGFLRLREERRHLIRSLLQQEEPVLPLASAQLRQSVLDAEVDALELLDVPLFQAKGCDLLVGERTLVAGFFATSGYRGVARRLRELNPEALDATLNCLRLLWIQTALSSGS